MPYFSTNGLKYVIFVCMNKDVIYIEPEDDITDIINRIKTAKQKIVALVPPQKIGVLRSALNTKLVAKTAAAVEKAVVIVTVDPALIKLAISAGIPVAKNLQSRPMMPSEISQLAQPEEEIIDETKEKTAAPAYQPHLAPKQPDQVINSQDLAEPETKSDKTNKPFQKASKTKIPNLDRYRKWIILGAAGFVLLVGLLVWALVIAPSAKISVLVRTTANNFSENINFTLKTSEEDVKSGKLLLEEQKQTDKAETEFVATGTKNVGEKASGKLVLTAYFKDDNNKSKAIPAGTVFSTGEQKFTITKATAITVENTDSCEKANSLTEMGLGCKRSITVDVVAQQPGAASNIAAGTTNWTCSVAGVIAANAIAFTGGTDKNITIVQQSDIDKAKEKLSSSNETSGKKKLIKGLSKSMVALESSFKQTVGDPVSTPKLGEEVKEGVTPKLESTTTYTMYAVDKANLEDYIRAKSKSKVSKDQKLYSVGSPFIERFVQNDKEITAKLKTILQVGPKITERDILAKSQGRKIGEVQSLIKSINGVSTVTIKPSFFWVTSVPSNANKVTIELKVEE